MLRKATTPGGADLLSAWGRSSSRRCQLALLVVAWGLATRIRYRRRHRRPKTFTGSIRVSLVLGLAGMFDTLATSGALDLLGVPEYAPRPGGRSLADCAAPDRRGPADRGSATRCAAARTAGGDACER
jgi:hypothetical protein